MRQILKNDWNELLKDEFSKLSGSFDDTVVKNIKAVVKENSKIDL